MSGFKYVRVMNIRKFCKNAKVLNMPWDAITDVFLIFQDSKYTKFLRIQALHEVLHMVK